MSRHTANRFMAVAEVYGAKSSTVQHLDIKALYELTAPKTPVEVREEIEAYGGNTNGGHLLAFRKTSVTGGLLLGKGADGSVSMLIVALAIKLLQQFTCWRSEKPASLAASACE